MTLTDTLITAVDDWPWVLPVVLLMIVFATQGTKILSFLKDSIWLPTLKWFGRMSYRDKERLDAELEDLRRQVEFLTQQIEELRLRDELYWEFVITDQEWHRQVEFRAVEEGWALPNHINFMEFREQWLARHNKYSRSQ